MSAWLAGLARCQSLISLRTFCAPCSLAWRHAMPHAAQSWQPAAWGGNAGSGIHRQLHCSEWRCRAAVAAQPADELSLNALKRRQQELEERIEEAIKVCSD